MASLERDWPEPRPEESELVARAVPKRRREFAAGRALAHAALAQLGAPDQPLLPGARRAPCWPPGFAGSISHADALCAVVVGRSDVLRWVGVDLEEDGPLPARVAPRVLRPDDVQRLGAVPGGTARAERLVFSVKECVYKALAPRLDRVLAFEELAVHWSDCASEAAGGFRACFAAPSEVPTGCPSEVAGRWLRADGHVLTVVALAPT